MTGDCMRPTASPIRLLAMKISQTVVELYIINQAIANGTLTAIMDRFRPKESDQRHSNLNSIMQKLHLDHSNLLI